MMHWTSRAVDVDFLQHGTKKKKKTRGGSCYFRAFGAFLATADSGKNQELVENLLQI